ncbi:hypothetical protein [Gilliamella sp. Pas-s95]|uniref:hypothetical protein n=1 Tax=Gilliamella sp. Pas-s95 TaxID=2687317 RepID=UPI0013213B96|nr:hypothetical protein [Gilliamella sp. Pas-s95]MWN05864.1 hypothetical protein [Gilliamella sp. Pas-s95]
MAFDLVISKPQLTWPSKPLKAKNSPQKVVSKGIDFIKVFIWCFLFKQIIQTRHQKLIPKKINKTLQIFNKKSSALLIKWLQFNSFQSKRKLIS